MTLLLCIATKALGTILQYVCIVSFRCSYIQARDFKFVGLHPEWGFHLEQGIWVLKVYLPLF